MERSEDEFIWRSEPESMVSVTVGRFMNTLLSTRPRKLQDSISRLSPDSHKGSGSVDEALWFLYKYVRDAVERDETMDEILVPIIEHTLRFKDTKHGSQGMILLNWLFQDEVMFQAITGNLSKIIVKKEDRFVALGWCFLVRALVECDGDDDQHSMNGIEEKHHMLVKIFSSCVPHLLLTVQKGSILQDGFELPSRLSVAAADCLLSITGALAKSNETLTKKPKPSSVAGSSQPIALIPNVSERRKMQSRGPESLNSEMKCLLWNHLEELTCLVQSLFAWNRKSRLLHAKGLNQVLKWLQEIKIHHNGSQDEPDAKVFMSGALLLSSCWKHYSVLLHLEDPKFSKICKELMEQYLSGIQYFSNSHSQGSSNIKNIETHKFFVNCLCLLFGRFEGKKFESIISEYGTRLVPSLLHQLRCNNEDVADGVVAILKATVFKQHTASGGSSLETRHMDIMIPALLNLLDERDSTAKAVIVLIAEYCSISTDNHCLNEVIQRLVSGTTMQRINAMDVISEIIHMSKDPIPSHIPWKEIADCLLKCLGDEETSISLHTVELLELIEPSFVLPALVSLMHSADGKVQSQATETLLRVLKHHKEDFDVICMLLDCLSNTPGTSGHSLEGSKFDNDRVLKLIPEWAKNVQNWNILIGPLLDKMFLEPSNVTIVRFLSCISEHLAEVSNTVLLRVLSHLKEQNGMDESLLSRPDTRSCSTGEAKLIEKTLFDRLCPLLILRLLPQRVFNDFHSSVMYGHVVSGDTLKGLDNLDIKFEEDQCVAAFLLKRAFSKFEFEEVRKLSAELCGRIHPQVLYPIVSLQLEEAARLQDILRIKACLFAICTALVIRGWESLSHPATPKIRKLLETILLWPPSENGISKAQHGCIDCLALMICAELQPVESTKASGREKVHTGTGVAASRESVLAYVIHHLTQDRIECSSMPKLDGEHHKGETPVPIPFRLCMANVLISACQKISDSAKKNFARKALPSLIHALKVICEPEVRAACIQVLFSATYHLKSMLLPYSSDLLKLSLRFLEQGSEKEKLAGAKLMASLMASEDVVVESISAGLMEARPLLSKASSSDTSPDVRQVCRKLLACLTPM